MYLVVGRKNCSYCDKAKEALETKGTPYVYIDITSGDTITDAVWKNFLVEGLEARTVPQIFRLLGGYDDLRLELLHVPNKE